VPVDHIIIRDIFTLICKFGLKGAPPSDWLAFTSSNWITSAWKALHGAVVLIIPTNYARRSKKLKCETVLA
jgi:hypothetical protein